MKNINLVNKLAKKICLGMLVGIILLPVNMTLAKDMDEDMEKASKIDCYLEQIEDPESPDLDEDRVLNEENIEVDMEKVIVEPSEEVELDCEERETNLEEDSFPRTGENTRLVKKLGLIAIALGIGLLGKNKLKVDK